MSKSFKTTVDIIGGGPSGIALAWYLSKDEETYVRIFEQRDELGGSWYEPSIDERNFHSVRAVFPSVFVNTRDLLKEMDVDFYEVFQPSNSSLMTNFKLIAYFSVCDLLKLSYDFIRINISPKHMTSESLQSLCTRRNISESGQYLVSVMSLVFDGVTWDKMSCYEFFKTIDYTGWNKMYFQKMSGRKFGTILRNSLSQKNNVDIFLSSKVASIKKPDTINTNHRIKVDYDAEQGLMGQWNTSTREFWGDVLVLAMDPSNLSMFLLENSPVPPENIRRFISDGEYHSITVIFYFSEDVKAKDEIICAIETEWNILCQNITPNIVACTLVNMDKPLKSTSVTARFTPPDKLVTEIAYQCQFPYPLTHKICWGAQWVTDTWQFSQSGGVLPPGGSLPQKVFLDHSTVAYTCGMNSPRNTPFSSLEAAVEIGRRLAHTLVNTSKPRSPWTLCSLIAVVILVILLTVSISLFLV